MSWEPPGGPTRRQRAEGDGGDRTAQSAEYGGRADPTGTADRRCCSRTGRASGQPRPGCSSARRPSSTTSARSTRSSASTPGPSWSRGWTTVVRAERNEAAVYRDQRDRPALRASPRSRAAGPLHDLTLFTGVPVWLVTGLPGDARVARASGRGEVVVGGTAPGHRRRTSWSRRWTSTCSTSTRRTTPDCASWSRPPSPGAGSSRSNRGSARSPPDLLDEMAAAGDRVDLVELLQLPAADHRDL